jgi:hypothetical protein
MTQRNDFRKVFGGQKTIETSQFFFCPEGFVEKGVVQSSNNLH